MTGILNRLIMYNVAPLKRPDRKYSQKNIISAPLKRPDRKSSQFRLSKLFPE